MVEAKLDYETDYALMVDDWCNISVLQPRPSAPTAWPSLGLSRYSQQGNVENENRDFGWNNEPRLSKTAPISALSPNVRGTSRQKKTPHEAG